jgi:hypothetical protein
MLCLGNGKIFSHLFGRKYYVGKRDVIVDEEKDKNAI